MVQARPKALTFEEFLQYRDGTDSRYELVDGELVLMPEPSPQHSDITEFIYDSFKFEVKRFSLDWKVKFGDVGVRTGIRSSRTPDIAVIEGAVWRQLRATKSSAILEVPLLLAIEVVSPGEESAERDYRSKRAEYEAIGIPEYWIVDPWLNKVSVFWLVEGRYQIHEVSGDQLICSKIFPQLRLTATDILCA
jgi:Uma2 family endonuclease